MDQISWSFLTFSSLTEKNWQLGTCFSGSCRCQEVTIIERFKQEAIYGLSAGTKISGHCREVAIVGSWLLVEVQL